MKYNSVNSNKGQEVFPRSQTEDNHLSYSLSPGKLTKGSQMNTGGDKVFMNSLKNQTETLFKKNKVLEDDQYKLQSKIKNVKKKLKNCINVFFE
jgi:hypothetical protein